MTKRQVFYSFHFKNDSWRAGQVRNIGVVEGNTPVSSNDVYTNLKVYHFLIKKCTTSNRLQRYA